MKLSELDKSKLPVKMYNNFFCNIWDILFVSDKHAICRREDMESWFDSNSDVWSPYQEPKEKVALYMYKHKDSKCWSQTAGFYKDEKEARRNFSLNDDFELKRLSWSEMEV